MFSINLLKQTALYALLSTATAVSIAEINGIAYLSPFSGRNVTDVSGVVTAKSSTGIFVRSLRPDNDSRSSESIFVFDRTQANQRRVGEIITFGGRVVEFRTSSAFVPLTEITNPAGVRVIGNGTVPLPLVLGSSPELSPPTEEFNSLDNGNVFGIPNNISQISRTNRPLEPSKYNMDFWESLVGELVTVPRPTAASKPNNFGDTWVYGAWPVTGRNDRGGLTQVGSDANGEAINIGSPLDGSRNPNSTLLGDSLADITGVVFQQFGFYYILPTTAIKIQPVTRAGPPAARFTACSACSDLTIGSYNVENLSPNSTSINGIAGHIAGPLKSPALMILQEIQDDNGPINDNVVDANITLSTLARLIRQRGGASYNFTDIPPVDDTNGGQPGGNIRSAYLYDSRYVRLVNPRRGSSAANTTVSRGLFGPMLSANPGLIEPLNPAFDDSRRPIAAQWTTADGISTFFTVNLHLSSKGGSTSLQGDARPPVNNGVDRRGDQLAIVGRFVRSILDIDRNAAVMVAGDFNEFEAVAIFADFKRVFGLVNIDEAAGTPPVERYSYLFGQNSQQLDQFFVSDRIARRRPEIQHVHLNTWVSSAEQVSDHDPSVAKVNVCRF